MEHTQIAAKLPKKHTKLCEKNGTFIWMDNVYFHHQKDSHLRVWISMLPTSTYLPVLGGYQACRALVGASGNTPIQFKTILVI